MHSRQSTRGLSVTRVSLADNIVFALVNACIYVRHPRYALSCRRRMGYWPNFATPRRLGELVQWRKLFDRNPAFVTFADKLAVKHWVAQRVPELAVPATLWAGERPEDIPDHLLGPDVVIKTNNASDQNYFPHRQGADRGEINRLFNRWLSDPFVRNKRLGSMQEWAYGPVVPKVMVEARIGGGAPVVDIGVRAFNGAVFAVSVATDYKTDRAAFGYYAPDGTAMQSHSAAHGHDLPADFRLPAGFAAAVAFARRISAGFDYLRVDFLAAGDELYLGEITVYPSSGFGGWDWRTEATYRHWLRSLDVSWFLRTPRPWPLSIYRRAFRRWLTVRRRAPPTVPEPFPGAAMLDEPAPPCPDQVLPAEPSGR